MTKQYSEQHLSGARFRRVDLPWDEARGWDRSLAHRLYAERDLTALEKRGTD